MTDKKETINEARLRMSIELIKRQTSLPKGHQGLAAMQDILNKALNIFNRYLRSRDANDPSFQEERLKEAGRLQEIIQQCLAELNPYARKNAEMREDVIAKIQDMAITPHPPRLLNIEIEKHEENIAIVDELAKWPTLNDKLVTQFLQGVVEFIPQTSPYHADMKKIWDSYVTLRRVGIPTDKEIQEGAIERLIAEQKESVPQDGRSFFQRKLSQFMRRFEK